MSPAEREPIAVVGLGFKFPRGAESASSLWDTLVTGDHGPIPVPKIRGNVDAFYHPDRNKAESIYVRKANYTNGDPAEFDCSFFQINPVEASAMDPQVKHLLEASYHALENAGMTLENVKNSRTGVFVSSAARDYEGIISRDHPSMSKYTILGICSAMLANRISWFYGLKGPSIALDTACAGSVTAVHLACQSLYTGECNMALAGGVSIVIDPVANFQFVTGLGFMSPDGQCWSFDARANGYGKGEGVGLVVLKRLSDAIADGDTIRAVIHGTSINHVGRVPIVTQPSVESQAENILNAYRVAKLDPKDTPYFEAHGTGTPVGDPIEAAAIHAAFQRQGGQKLDIGTLKANIGHLEAAAGIASVIKSILVLENGVIPPNAGYRSPNPEIPIASYNFNFEPKARLFPKNGPRRISINNFGFGGSNSHAILGDARNYLRSRSLKGKHSSVREGQLDVNGPQHSQLDALLDSRDLESAESLAIEKSSDIHINGNHHHNGLQNGHTNGESTEQIDHRVTNGATTKLNGHKALESSENGEITPKNGHSSLMNGNGAYLHTNGHVSRRPPVVLPWSSSDENGVSRVLEVFRNHSSDLPDSNGSLHNMYLANLSYTLSARRSKLPWKVCSIQEGIQAPLEPAAKPVRSTGHTDVSFIFTGQGAQWSAMGRELEHYDVYFKSLKASQTILRELGCEWDLFAEMHKDADLSRVDIPEFSQPLCTALQIALVDLLEFLGVRPSTVIGHSSGEIAAAYCAGALSQTSAMKVAYFRGLLVEKLRKSPGFTPGNMISIGLGSEDAIPHLAKISQTTGGSLTIACSNSPKNVTVSGDVKSVALLEKTMEQLSIFGKSLSTGVAYHSAYMQEISKEYTNLIADLEGGDTSRIGPTIFSTVLGKQVELKAMQQASYWALNLVKRVQFTEALSSMVRFLTDGQVKGARGDNFLLEVGPHGALQRPVKDTLHATTFAKDFHYASLLSRGKSSFTTISESCAQLWCRGGRINLTRLSFPEVPYSQLQTLIDLPKYPFNHSQRYLNEPRVSKNYRFRSFSKHDFLGTRDLDWNPTTPIWKNMVRVSEQKWMLDHCLDKTAVFPGSGMLVTVIEGMRQLCLEAECKVSGFTLQDVFFENPIVVQSEESLLDIQLILHASELDSKQLAKSYSFELFNLVQDKWIRVSRGKVELSTSKNSIGLAQKKRLRLQLSDPEYKWGTASKEQYYRRIKNFGFDFGEAFRMLDDVQFFKNAGRARIVTNQWEDKHLAYPSSPQLIHPVDLDALFQMVTVMHSLGGERHIDTLVPIHLKSLFVSEALFSRVRGAPLQLEARKQSEGTREIGIDVAATDDNGHVALVFEDLRFTTITNSSRQNGGEKIKRSCFHLEWKPDLDLLAEEQLQALCNGKASKYVELLAHKRPGLNILQIGAGSGDTTHAITTSLTRTTRSLPLFKHYTYADISSTSLEEVSQRFSALSDVMSFSELDISIDPVTQGFAEKQYDLIVCSLTAHVASDITRLVRNIRKLLLSGGKLLALGASWPEASIMGHTNGLPPEEALPNNSTPTSFSTLTLDKWNSLLLENGFDGAKLRFVDSDTRYTGFVATAVENVQTATATDICIIVDQQSQDQQELASTMKRLLSTDDKTIGIDDQQQWRTGSLTAKTIVFLLDYASSTPFIQDEHNWQSLKDTAVNAESMIFITRPPIKGNQAFPGLLSGFLRVLRNELYHAKITEINLEQESNLSKTAELVLTIVRPVAYGLKHHTHEQYVEKSGHFVIGRLEEAETANEMLQRQSGKGPAVVQALGSDPERPLKLTADIPGDLQSLVFQDDPDFDRPLDVDEVKIAVRATGIGSEDAQIAAGKDDRPYFGMEFAGVVTDIGKSGEIAVGDKVCGLTLSGAYRTCARTDRSALLKIPAGMSFSAAAALPRAYATAWYALVQMARISVNEAILITCASSAVGQAAIHIARSFNARIIATAPSLEARALLLTGPFGFSEEDVYLDTDQELIGLDQDSNLPSFDILLSLDANTLHSNILNKVSALGRIIDARDDTSQPLISGQFQDSIAASIFNVRLATVLANAKPLTGKIMQGIAAFLEAQNTSLITPQPLQVYSASLIAAAFKQIEKDDGKTGKLVVEYHGDDQVSLLPTKRLSYRFRSDATYVIAGGLGGLGPTIIRWMADNGARNFLVLSRSGSEKNRQAEQMIKEMKLAGIIVEAPPCDIADLKTISKVVEECQSRLPPVRGCLHAAMVMNDSSYQNMTYEEFMGALQPKVPGTINLRTVLPDDLDFFVMFSSITGIVGIRGQANYAAGNTFQDQFAFDQVSQGRRCVSINLGPIQGVGATAERGLNDSLRRDGISVITETELLSLLGYVCDPACELALDPLRCQLLTGFGMAEEMSLSDFQNCYWSDRPMFQYLHLINQDANRNLSGAGDGGASANIPIRKKLAESGSLDSAKEIVLQHLIAKIAKLLMVPEQDVAPRQAIATFGFDSVVALELRYWVSKEFEVDVSVFEIMSALELEEFAGTIVGKVGLAF